MHAVEFNVTVRNGLIALPENQKNWNGKTIKVILLESSSHRIVERFAETDDFFSPAGMWAQRDDITQESLRNAAWRAPSK